MTLSFKTEPLQNKYIGLRNAEDIIQNLKKKKENQSKLSDSSGFYSNAWYQRECLIYSYAAL